jgi:hypothetical protein
MHGDWWRSLRRLWLAAGILGAVAGLAGAQGPAGRGPAQVSDVSPFADCTLDEGPTNTGDIFPDAFPNSEVEPWVDVNPRDRRHLVGTWQQDRWDNGGARGLLAGVSRDGGTSWKKVVIPGLTFCSGGEFPRASDPWLSFSPDGTVHHISLALDVFTPFPPDGFGPNALLVSRSSNGGLDWSQPTEIIRDLGPLFLNDKETITADPHDARFVYAVWDRIEQSRCVVFREIGCDFVFKGPAWFARTTDGGDTWEVARPIYDPGRNNQTLGNEIVVTPEGTLINAFNGIHNIPADGLDFGFNVAVLRSTDRGATWSRPIRVDRLLSRALLDPAGGVRDPDTNRPIRTGDILPQAAVDRRGRIYLVWQDAAFSRFQHDDVALSMSSDDGISWTVPVQVNRTPERPGHLGAAFTPAIKVARDGTIGIFYYDLRHHRAGGRALATDAWLARYRVDRRGALRFLGETRLTPVSFDLRRAPVARGLFLGDYVGLGVRGDTFTPFFTVTTDDDPGNVVAISVRSKGDRDVHRLVTADPAAAGARAALARELALGRAILGPAVLGPFFTSQR